MDARAVRRSDPMQVAPVLPPARRGTPVPRTVLLVNPFYPKDVRERGGAEAGGGAGLKPRALGWPLCRGPTNRSLGSILNSGQWRRASASCAR